MDVNAIHEILRDCCEQRRKGAEIERSESNGLAVTEIYMMPPAANDDTEIDLHFIKVAVKPGAEIYRARLTALLDDWPDPEQLKSGPSFIAVGAVLGDQGAALELFALGKALGLWDIITPESFGFRGDQAKLMAGTGFIMCTGYPRQ